MLRLPRAGPNRIPRNAGPAAACAALCIALAIPASAQLDNLEFIGHNEVNPAHLMHAEIVGTRVYISEGLGSNGVETYDISDPANPVRIATLAPPTGAGSLRAPGSPPTWRTRAYPAIQRLFGFAHHEGVQMYDMSGTLTLMREYDPQPGVAYEGGALRGTTLYVAAYQTGIDIIDVSDPGPMQRIGNINLGQNAAWDAEIVGSHLLVANGRFGLWVVDLDATPPAVVATIPLGGLANDILVSGTTAFVSLGPAGLASFDVADPTSPVLLHWNRETTGNVTEIGLLGTRLVVGAWTRLEIYDVADPRFLRLVGWDDTKTWAMGADLNDDPGNPLVVVADWRGISTYRPAPDTAPDIEVIPKQIDFGSVAAPEDTLVRVYNRGSAPLVISSTSVPSGFTVQPSAFTVPPGGAQEVTVTASGFGTIRNSIRYFSNDPDEATFRQYVYKNNAGAGGFPQLGSPAPDFTLMGTDGVPHTLSAELGKVVFLEFGANW